MCAQVNKDEWSGMLFYDTFGDLGNDDFRIVANEFYLLDIGHSTYTEYDLTKPDPEFIKFLMTNKHIMNMKKGHIHSHNTMGVFFSGTDDKELIENSEHHNFYLSIIVNNKNEIIGKVAFRAKSTGETKKKITFRGVDGKETTKDITSSFEDTVVYYHECIVTSPHSLGDSLSERVQSIEKTKEEERRRLAALKPTTPQRYSPSQVELFDDRDLRDSRRLPTKIYSKKQRDFEKEIQDYYTPLDPKDTRTDPRVYSMLIKLLNLDFLCEGTSLETTLNRLESQLYPLAEEMGMATPDPNAYMDELEGRAVDFYIDSFPEDQHLVGFDDTMDRCIEIVEFYQDKFPNLVGGITDSLNLTIGD